MNKKSIRIQIAEILGWTEICVEQIRGPEIGKTTPFLMSICPEKNRKGFIPDPENNNDDACKLLDIMAKEQAQFNIAHISPKGMEPGSWDSTYGICTEYCEPSTPEARRRSWCLMFLEWAK